MRKLLRSWEFLYVVVQLLLVAAYALLRQREMLGRWGWPLLAVNIVLFAALCLHKRWHILGAVGTALMAVLFAEGRIDWVYFHQEPNVLWWAGLAWNTTILACLALVLSAITSRPAVGLLGMLAIYGFLQYSNVMKLVSLNCPVRVSDIQMLVDLSVMAKGVMNVWIILAIVGAAAVAVTAFVLAWRKGRFAAKAWRRLLEGGVSACLLFSLVYFPGIVPVRTWLEESAGLIYPINSWDARDAARCNGLLGEIALRWRQENLDPPDGYCREAVQEIVRRYQLDAPPTTRPADRQLPNLVFLLVESMMDPNEFGIRFTHDPIPNIRKAGLAQTHGRSVVPTYGGRSVNTEFEVLTGMALYFLPDESCPYRQWLTRDVPTLPSLLRKHGYRSEAIFADPPWLFDREKVMMHLGFDRCNFLMKDPCTPLDPSGVWVSDDALVDACIAASKKGGPWFTFAFPAATHRPWKPQFYKNSTLDVIEPNMPEPLRQELKAYINTLQTMDRAVARLLAHLQTLDRETIVYIMGDHMPPFGGPDGVYEYTNHYNLSRIMSKRRQQETPGVLWSNKGIKRPEFRWSTNFLPIRLLQEMGIPPEGLIALTGEVHKKFPVLSRYVETADGKQFLEKDPNIPFQDVLRDYRMLQYDLLKGENFSSEK